MVAGGFEEDFGFYSKRSEWVLFFDDGAAEGTVAALAVGNFLAGDAGESGKKTVRQTGMNGFLRDGSCGPRLCPRFVR